MENTLKTLLIDDSSQDAQFLLHALSLSGLETESRRVCTVEDLINALLEKTWDIIFCDFQMPDLTADTALELCRDHALNTPVIVVSGAINDEQAVDLLKGGAYDFVRKDNLARLVPAVERALKDGDARRRQREAEATLRENERFLSKLFENLPEMIFVKDASELRFLRINRAGEELLGIDRSELIGKNDYDFFPKEEADFFIRKDRETLSSGQLNTIAEETIRTRNRGTRILHTKKIPVMDDNGVPKYLLGLSEDITDRKKTEEQLRHNDKMQALGVLAGGVAHDFNNILTSIIGFSSLIERRLQPDDPSHGHIQQVIRSGEQAANLTKALLSYSRKDTIKLEVTDLNEIMHLSSKLLRRLLGEEIVMTTSLHGKRLPINADKSQIEQVLMNLAVNARDAMPRGGILNMSTDLLDIDQTFIDSNGFGTPGRYALLSVSDNGAGMNDDTRQRIFEPFFTTKETGSGTGLGLSIVHGIVTQHNGHITVTSKTGQGTLFQIYLPLCAEAETGNTLSTVQELPHGSETILLVEDNGKVKDLISCVLQDYGYQVVTADNGLQAILVADRLRNEIDMAIIDVIMPGKNGREVFNELRHIVPELKVLFVSGYPQEIVSGKGILEEGVNFMAKPIIPGELLFKVREIMDSNNDVTSGNSPEGLPT